MLDAALADLAEGPAPLGQTLDEWGRAWLATLAVSPHYKPTSIARDEDRWRCYVSGSLLGQTPLIDVSERDVRTWLASLRGKSGKPLAGQTLSNALSLVRRALEAARQSQRVEANVAAEVKLPKGARVQRGDRWTWLRADEIDRVLACDAIPLRARSIYATAIYTGLRAGELWGLRWSDVDYRRGVLHVQHSYDGAPKSWQIREVPMFAPVIEALRAWGALSRATGVRSRFGLVWPGDDEGPHAEGYDSGWADRVEGKGADRRVTPGHKSAAGLKRRVRFHDLRHTCASHLLQGTWSPAMVGRALRIEEVKAVLGHSDVSVTQRYAHLASDAIRSLVVPARSGRDLDTTDKPPPGIEPGAYGLRNRPGTRESGPIEGETGLASSDVSSLRALAVAYARAVERGDPCAHVRGLALVEAVLKATEDRASRDAAERSE